MSDDQQSQSTMISEEHGARADGVRLRQRLCALLVGLAAMLAATLAGTPAASATPTQDAAVSWAAAQNGSTAWDGLCLKFVHDAYLAAGFDTSTQATDNSSAVAFWNTYYGYKYTDTNPPAGALVFWGATSSNPYGHVAISTGDGHTWSTYERSYRGVHLMTIAYRNEQGYPYLGYILI